MVKSCQGVLCNKENFNVESAIKCLYKGQSMCLHEQWFQNLFGIYCFLFTIRLCFLLICPFDRHSWFLNDSGFLPFFTIFIFLSKRDQLLKCLRILLPQTNAGANQYRISIGWTVGAWIEEIIIKSKEYDRQSRKGTATQGITV